MNARRVNKRNWLIACVVGTLSSAPAFAVNYACTGPVDGVSTGPGGVVSAANAGGQQWGYFCQLDGTSNNVSAAACKGVLAVLLAAQTSGKSVTIWFNDDLSCSTHASWAWLNTWYWGPSIS